MNYPAFREALTKDEKDPIVTSTGRTFREKHPRHPAEVTCDPLPGAAGRWVGKSGGGETDMISMIHHALAHIAEGGS